LLGARRQLCARRRKNKLARTHTTNNTWRGTLNARATMRNRAEGCALWFSGMIKCALHLVRVAAIHHHGVAGSDQLLQAKPTSHQTAPAKTWQDSRASGERSPEGWVVGQQAAPHQASHHEPSLYAYPFRGRCPRRCWTRGEEATQVNSSAHGPQKLTGLISLLTNPASISSYLFEPSRRALNAFNRLMAGFV
jgi:hypothetical protein